MEVLKIIGKVDSDGHLRLDLATDLPEGKVDLVLVINSGNKDSKKKYEW